MACTSACFDLTAGAMSVALGSGATGTFAKDDDMWKLLYQVSRGLLSGDCGGLVSCSVFHKAGHKTGDRLWRMPLFSQYRKQIDSHLADINNVGQRGRYSTMLHVASYRLYKCCHLVLHNIFLDQLVVAQQLRFSM